MEANSELDIPQSVEPASGISVEPPPSAPALTSTGRPRRNYRLPDRYRDIHPEGPAPLPPLYPLPQIAPGSSALPQVILHTRDTIRTGVNRFGLLREYPHRPSHDPDSTVELDDLTNFHVLQTAPSGTNSSKSSQPPTVAISKYDYISTYGVDDHRQ